MRVRARCPSAYRQVRSWVGGREEFAAFRHRRVEEVITWFTLQMVAVGLSGDESKRAVEAALGLRVFGEEAQQQQISQGDEQRRLVASAVAVQQLIVEHVVHDVEAAHVDEHIEIVVRTLGRDAAHLKEIDFDLHAIVGGSDELVEHDGVLRVIVWKIRT